MSAHIEVNNIELSLGIVGPQGVPGPTGPAGSAGNIDGGSANSNYTGTQPINGGTAGSF
jgi:hypothetical protein